MAARQPAALGVGLRRLQLDDAEEQQRLDDGIGRVELVPPRGEVEAVGQLVVVVLEELSHHEPVCPEDGVARLVVVVEVLVAVHVAKPVNDGTVYRAHQKVEGQQQKQIPSRSRYEIDVEQYVCRAPAYTAVPAITYRLQPAPDGNVTVEAGLGLNVVVYKAIVDVFGFQHHREDIFGMVRGMRIPLCV